MSDNLVPPPAAPGGYPPAGAPQPNFPPAGGPAPQKSNGLGIAALILGIVALVFAFIPIANYFGMFVAVVGLVLGIVGLVLKNRSKGTALTGTILSGVALVLAIIMAVVYAAAFSAAVKAVDDAGSSITSTSSSPSASTSSDSNAAKPVDVVYEVTSDAGTASITYYTINNGQSGQEQANDAPLPWSKELQLKQNGLLDFNAMSLTAIASQDATTITCTIKVDGVVKSTQTSTGSFAVVSCNTDGK